MDLRIGWINPGTFAVALTTQYSALFQAMLPLPGSIADSSSATPSSSMSFEWSKSPFLLSQYWVFKMLSGAPASSPSAGPLWIHLIPRMSHTSVRPPRMLFADKDGGKGDLSDNVYAAAPSCWKFDQNALMMSLVSEMYYTAVLFVFGVRHSFSVACRLWLPSHISQKSLTLANLCNVLSSTCFFKSKLFSVSVLSNAAQSLANIPSLARGNWLTTTCSRSVSPVTLDWLQVIMSHAREQLPSPQAPCGGIENMSHATLPRSVYFECIFCCWRHQLVISGNQNVLLLCMGS